MSRSHPVSIGDPDAVQAWPFKEPEKKSAWKDEPVKDVPIAMVDHELEKAKRRTAEIREQMSAPGTLGLTPLLEAQRIKWGIPDGAFKCRAVFDRIHVFPIDIEGQKETYGSGLIQRAESMKKRDLQNGHRGILISMGLEAADKCVSHGIELGHVITTIRNAPHAMVCARLSMEEMFYLVMRVGDLTGSETQEEELRAGRTRIVDDGGDHSYCYNIEGRKKRGVFINDNW